MKFKKSMALLAVTTALVSVAVLNEHVLVEAATESVTTTNWTDSDFVIEGTILKKLSAQGQAKWNAGDHNIVINNDTITEIADYFAASASLFETDGTLVINSSSLQRIGESAFSSVAFRSITINAASLTTIDERAFYSNGANPIILNTPKLTRVSGWAFFGRIGLKGVERLENVDFSTTGINFVGKETFTDTRLITLVPIKVNDHKIFVQNAAFGNKGEVDNGNPFGGLFGSLFGGGISTTPYTPIFFAPVNSSTIQPYAETTYANGDTTATTSELGTQQKYQLIRPYTVEFKFWEEQADGSLKEITVSDDVVNTLLESNGTKKPDGYDTVRTDKDGRVADAATNSYTNTRGIFTLTDVDLDSYTAADFPLDRKEESPNSFNTTYYPISEETFQAAKAKLVTALANVKTEGTAYNYEAPTLAGYTFERVSDEHDSNVGKYTDKAIRIDYIYKKEPAKTANLTVKYVDTDGDEIKTADVTSDLAVGSDYDTSSKRDAEITTTDGTVYRYQQLATDSAAETGTVAETGTTVTYVYKKVVNGTVTVLYTDTAGINLQDPTTLTGEVGTTYDATKGKPTTITYKGKTYQYKTLASDSAAATGNFAEDVMTVHFIYEEVIETPTTGSVTVRYQTASGAEIKKADITSDLTVGNSYDVTDKQVATITVNGKTYRFSKVADGSSATGTVVAGNTDVVYVYEEVTGSVRLRYVDAAGNAIADDAVTTGLSLGANYSYGAPASITVNGKTYNLKVTPSNSTGTVVEGETLVTFVYEEVVLPTYTSLTINYVTDTGVTIKSSEVLTNQVAGNSYDVTAKKLDTITYNGKLYRFSQLADGSSLTGTIAQGGTVVTLVYTEVVTPDPTPTPNPDPAPAPQPNEDTDQQNQVGGQITNTANTVGTQKVLPQTNSRSNIGWTAAGFGLLAGLFWTVLGRKKGNKR